MSKNIVVIGSGAAGMTAASTARRNDPDARIVLLTEDEHIAYSPCVIPWALEGKTTWEEIVMHEPDYYRRERGIDVKTLTKVTSVDIDKGILTAGEEDIPFDSVVLATGGNVFIPPIPGKDLEGVHVVRTINDGKAIERALNDVQEIAVIGAGVIGLEMALSLVELGKGVTVVEMMDQVVPRILDSDLAGHVRQYLEDKGVRFLMGSPIQSVDGDSRVESVTVGGQTVPCGMVIFSTGVRANLEIPNQIGLDIGALGGVRVSPSMQPYRKGRLINNVFVCGDVVQCESAIVAGPTMSQLGSSAVRQGRVAGINAAGGNAMHEGVASPWVSVIGDLQVAGTGISSGLASWYGIEVVVGIGKGFSRARYYPGGTPMTVKVIAEKSTGRLIGAQIISGEDATGRINWLSAAIIERVTAGDFISRYENAYCPPTSMVRDVAFAAMEDLVSKF